jgi:hypothetical protein
MHTFLIRIANADEQGHLERGLVGYHDKLIANRIFFFLCKIKG